MMRQKISKYWLLLFMLSGPIWLGFVLHTSAGDVLLLDKYTPAYTLLLVFLTLLWLYFLYLGWRWQEKLGHILRIAGLNFLIAVIILAVILPPVFIYMHQKSLKDSLLSTPGPNIHSFFQIDMTSPLSEPESPDAVRILTLGGSTTYGTKLERIQTYPAVLERLLNDRYPDGHFEVYNAGVPWHTSMHSLLRYVALYATWKPDIVIIMHAFNDIFQTSEGQLTFGAFRSDYGHFFGALSQRINPKDHLTEKVKRLLLNNWFARTFYSDIFSREDATKKKQVDLYRALPHFRRNLCELIRRAHNDGAQVVLLTQPSLYQDEMTQEQHKNLFYDYYYRDYAITPTIHAQSAAMGAFNQAAREVANTCGAFLLDLEQHIPKEAAYMYDDVHYTVKGAEEVSHAVLDGLPWKDFAYLE